MNSQANDSPKPLDVDSMEYLSTVSVELHSQCNLKCSMCSHHTNPRKPHMMSVDHFKTILDKLADTPIKKLAFNMGEPFMNRYIYRMISYAKRKDFFVYISTNGALLKEEDLGKILKTGVDALKFSIEGYSPEVYESIRRGSNFDRVFRNVVRMKELRDRAGSKLYTWIHTILTQKNPDIVEFLKFWGPYCDEVEYSGLTDHIGLVDNKDLSLSPTWKPRKSCPQVKPFQEVDILSNGDMVLCCVDFHGRCVLGNLLEQSFQEIWTSEKMKNIRRKAYGDRLDELSPCRDCAQADYTAVFPPHMRYAVSLLHSMIKSKQWQVLENVKWTGGGGKILPCVGCGGPLDISFAGFCGNCVRQRSGNRGAT